MDVMPKQIGVSWPGGAGETMAPPIFSKSSDFRKF